MRVHASALKHGILAEDAVQAATWALWIEDLDDETPARQLRLGFGVIFASNPCVSLSNI